MARMRTLKPDFFRSPSLAKHPDQRLLKGAPCVGVCGFGRCGSSAVMAMLHAGGVTPVTGSDERSYEVDFRTLRCRHLPGHAVKLLDLDDQVVSRFPQFDWRFIWIDRDATEQARSMVKFITSVLRLRVPTTTAIRESCERDREPTLDRLRARGQVLCTSYEALLAEPLEAALGIRRFLGGALGDFDAEAASSTVHHRGPECCPSLDWEMFGTARRRGTH